MRGKITVKNAAAEFRQNDRFSYFTWRNASCKPLMSHPSV
jgi:hypothetical protein